MPNKWYLKETTESLRGLTSKGLEIFTEILKDEIQKEAPGRIKIVTRKRHIASKVTVAATHPDGNMIPVWVEFGTPPHVIKAKNKQFLAFHWDKATDDMRKLPDGRVLFKQVHHPGTDPNPFMRRGTVRASFLADRAFHTV